MIKCIIWDLDNTIWNGILSEQDNIVLRDEIIKMIKFTTEKGIVNSICSKNDEVEAYKKLEEFSLLKYLILPQINWNLKSENIMKIISSLNFREENVLFIDDNQFELDEVKSKLPMINICNSYDAEKLSYFYKKCKEMKDELSRKRIKMYRIEEKRIIDQENRGLSKSEFLHSCNIVVNIKKADINDIERMEELIDRTNQLNSTGIRYSKNEIAKMLCEENLYDIFIANISDNYGSYGESGLVIMKKDISSYNAILFVVSCRLIGKGIGQTLLHYIYNIAKHNDYKYLKCNFKKNKFNRRMLILYTMNNFKKSETNNCIDEYSFGIYSNEILKPEWISLSETSC
ncbi:MAG: HAD-IIIC family phosphatase [Sarcina sp.]